MYEVWPDEIEKWKDFNELKIVILHGPKKDEQLKQEADIYAINPEGLDWLLDVQKTKTPRGKTRVNVASKRFKAFGFDTLVVDELSKFKSTNTNRFKALKHVLGTFRRRWGLTGSPAAQSLLDLFGQCFILDEGHALGRYITHYRMNYFIQGYDGFSWDIREGAEKEIYKKLSPLVLRMDAEDYIQMPKIIENNIRVTLPDDVMEIYKHLEKDLIAMVKGKLVTAATAATASTKCRQVANGGVYVNPEIEALVKLQTKKKWVNLHDVKIEALADLIDELQGSPLLIAYDFHLDLDKLKIRFGKDLPFIGGGVKPKRAKELINLWNAGKLPILAGHPQAIGHGLNLQEFGFHICWHSLIWSFELYDQFIRRIRRSGQKSKKVFVHHIIARNTIDELMLTVLKSKDHTQRALFNALKEMGK